MPLLRLCSNDPIVTTLTEVFHANLVRIPEERIVPLKVLAVAGDRTYFRGGFADLLSAPDPFDAPVPQSSLMPDLSGKKSRSVNVDLGLKVLDSYLNGFGVPSAGLLDKFHGVTTVSFAFRGVKRKWIDIDTLGKLLKNARVDRKNPAAGIFFEKKPYLLLLIDSVITSSDFSISVEKSSGGTFQFDVGKIQQIVGGINGKVSVETTSGFDLVFKADRDLAFAFSCVRLKLHPTSGAISLIEPSGLVPPITFRAGGGKSGAKASVQKVRLAAQPSMLSFDPDVP